MLRGCTTADENDAQMDLRGMAVPAMPKFEVRSQFTRAGRPCHENPFHERYEDTKIHTGKNVVGSSCLGVFVVKKVFGHIIAIANGGTEQNDN
jgi:hypothetical protein